MRTNSQFFAKRNKKRHYEIWGVYFPLLKRKDRSMIELGLAFKKFEKYLEKFGI